MNEPQDLRTYHDPIVEPKSEDPTTSPHGQPEPLEEIDDQEQEEAREQEPDLYEVPIKDEYGQTKIDKVSLEELKNGYMRNKDYTRKTTDVSRQREGLADALRQAIDYGRHQFSQQLQTLHDAVVRTVDPELRNVDWQSLAESDPEKYNRLQARGHQFNLLLQQIEQKQREQVDTQSREDQARYDERRYSALEECIETIPDWSEQRYNEVLAFVANTYGFDRREVAAVINPKIIRVMFDATKYRQGQSQRDVAKKKIAAAPMAIPSGSPASRPGDHESRLMAKAQKTGKMDDAVRALAARLDRPQR